MALNSMSRKELLKTANPVTEDFTIETVKHKRKVSAESTKENGKEQQKVDNTAESEEAKKAENEKDKGGLIRNTTNELDTSDISGNNEKAARIPVQTPAAGEQTEKPEAVQPGTDSAAPVVPKTVIAEAAATGTPAARQPEPIHLSEAEEPVLARSFRLLPQTATFIKKRSAFERMPEQSYVNRLFDRYAGIREDVNIMELEPPSLHGASNKSIRLLEHVDTYITDTCAAYGMKRSEFFNYIVEKEMHAVGWA